MHYNFWGLRGASLVAQLVKNLPAMWETWVRSLGWKDPLEKGKATHSGLENSMDYKVAWLQRVRHNQVTFTLTFLAISSSL